MRKIITLGIMLLFLGMTISSTTGIYLEEQTIKPMSKGNTLYVGGNGTGNYTEIQDAIDDASDGDTVFVYNGTYYEHVKINKSIEMVGENRDTTIIDANGSNLPVFLIVSYITVTGFTLQNSGNKWYNDAGVGIKNLGRKSNYNIITGNKMVNNYEGVFMWASHHNLISSNIIMNNRDDGIYFQAYCDNNNITGNIIINNSDNGINIQESDVNFISGNYIASNGKAGIDVYGNCDIYENIITDSNSGVIVNSKSHIYNNNFTKNQLGLHILYTCTCTVENNNFIENNRDATFSYLLFDRLRLPLMVFPQLTKWKSNYWENSMERAKTIFGIMIPFFLLLFFTEPLLKIPWINFDFSPANEPYDIPCVEMWY